MLTNRRTLLKVAGGAALATAASAQPGNKATLTGRILDAATGQTMACTVAIRKAEGQLVVENRAFLDGFRCPGTFRVQVPSGATQIRVTRGFDFEGEERNVVLQPDAVLNLEFRLRRRSPLLTSGWVCGDNHVHMTHGESRIVVDFDYVALAAQAEALDYLSIAQRWNMPNPTAAAVAEAGARVSTPGTLIAWNMEAPKNYFRGDVGHCLGHGWFVGARAVTTDGQDTAAELTAMSALDYQSDKPPTPNFESHALIHDLGGSVAYTHPCRWWWGNWGGRGGYPLETNKFVSNLAQELPFDTIAGPTYDSIDILMQTREKEVNAGGQQLWFQLLNHGYRMAATASTDASFDSEGHAVPGRVRTYSQAGAAPTLAKIAASMRAGNNFVTSGPLLSFTVDGEGPGSTVRADARVRRSARVRAWASGIPGEYLTRVEFVLNGDVVRSIEVPRRATYFEADHTWLDETGGWMIARCLGSDPDQQVAVTNAVYLEVGATVRPQPGLARLTVAIRDRRTSAPLSGRCDVLQMVGRSPRVLQTHTFQDGALVLTAPGTARLRFESPGYAPQIRSIFLDHPPILQATLNMRVEQLLDWSTFERFRQMLGQVTLGVDLERA